MSKSESRPRLTAARKLSCTRRPVPPKHPSARSCGSTACISMICATSNGHRKLGPGRPESPGSPRPSTDGSVARARPTTRTGAGREDPGAGGAEHLVHLARKKRSCGVTGLYAGQRLSAPEQQVIDQMITEAQTAGLTAQKACAVIGLSPRTLQRWRTPTPEVAGVSEAETPRPRSHNALTEREAATVVALIQSASHADASCRELALTLENGPFPTYVSHVTVWAYQRALHCNGPRGRQGAQGHRRTAPDTSWVSGPGQLWDWDVTYLATPERGCYLYLYSLIDHWSRKNIAWLIGTQFTSALAQTLWIRDSSTKVFWIVRRQPGLNRSATGAPRCARIRRRRISNDLGLANCSVGRGPPMIIRSSSRILRRSRPSRPSRGFLPMRQRPKSTSASSMRGTTRSIRIPG